MSMFKPSIQENFENNPASENKIEQLPPPPPNISCYFCCWQSCHTKNNQGFVFFLKALNNAFFSGAWIQEKPFFPTAPQIVSVLFLLWIAERANFYSHKGNTFIQLFE